MQYAVSKSEANDWLLCVIRTEWRFKTHRSLLACTHKTEKVQSTLRSDSLLTHYIPNQPCHSPAACRPSVLESRNCDQTPPLIYTRQTSINQPSWIRPAACTLNTFNVQFCQPYWCICCMYAVISLRHFDSIVFSMSNMGLNMDTHAENSCQKTHSGQSTLLQTAHVPW